MTQLHLPNGRRSEFLEGKKKKKDRKPQRKQDTNTQNHNKQLQITASPKRVEEEEEDIIIKFPRLGKSTWHRPMREEVHRETSNPQNPSSLVSVFLRVPVVAILVLVLFLLLLPQRFSESNLPLTSKPSSTSSLSKFASSSQPILLLLLLYNRTCKKPNHVALLLDLLVLLLSHTR